MQYAAIEPNDESGANVDASVSQNQQSNTVEPPVSDLAPYKGKCHVRRGTRSKGLNGIVQMFNCISYVE